MHFPVMVITETEPDDYYSEIQDLLRPYREGDDDDPDVERKGYKYDYMSCGPGRWDLLLNGRAGCPLKDYAMIRNTDTEEDLQRKFPECYRYWLEEKEKNGLKDYSSAMDYFKKRWCFSLVTPDGEWKEPGKLAWWLGTFIKYEPDIDWVDEFGKIIDSYPGDYWITLVDCHD